MDFKDRLIYETKYPPKIVKLVVKVHAITKMTINSSHSALFMANACILLTAHCILKKIQRHNHSIWIMSLGHGSYCHYDFCVNLFYIWIINQNFSFTAFNFHASVPKDILVRAVRVFDSTLTLSKTIHT